MQGTKQMDGLQYYCGELQETIFHLDRRGKESSDEAERHHSIESNHERRHLQDYQAIEEFSRFLDSIVEYIRSWASLALEKTGANGQNDEETNELNDDDILTILEHDVSFWVKKSGDKDPQLSKTVDVYVQQVRLYLNNIAYYLVDKDVEDLCEKVKKNISKVVSFGQQSLEDFNEDPEMLNSFTTKTDRKVAEEMMERRLGLLRDFRKFEVKKAVVDAANTLMNPLVILDSLKHLDIHDLRRFVAAIMNDHFIEDENDVAEFWRNKKKEQLDDIPTEQYSPALVKVFLREVLGENQEVATDENLKEVYEEEIKDLELLLKAHEENYTAERVQVHMTILQDLLKLPLRGGNKRILTGLVLDLIKRQYHWQVYRYYMDVMDDLLEDFSAERQQDFVRFIIDKAQKLCYTPASGTLSNEGQSKSIYSWD